MDSSPSRPRAQSTIPTSTAARGDENFLFAELPPAAVRSLVTRATDGIDDNPSPITGVNNGSLGDDLEIHARQDMIQQIKLHGLRPRFLRYLFWLESTYPGLTYHEAVDLAASAVMMQVVYDAGRFGPEIIDRLLGRQPPPELTSYEAFILWADWNDLLHVFPFSRTFRYALLLRLRQRRLERPELAPPAASADAARPSSASPSSAAPASSATGPSSAAPSASLSSVATASSATGPSSAALAPPSASLSSVAPASSATRPSSTVPPSTPRLPIAAAPAADLRSAASSSLSDAQPSRLRANTLDDAGLAPSSSDAAANSRDGAAPSASASGASSSASCPDVAPSPSPSTSGIIPRVRLDLRTRRDAGITLAGFPSSSARVAPSSLSGLGTVRNGGSSTMVDVHGPLVLWLCPMAPSLVLRHGASSTAFPPPSPSGAGVENAAVTTATASASASLSPSTPTRANARAGPSVASVAAPSTDATPASTAPVGPSASTTPTQSAVRSTTAAGPSTSPATPRPATRSRTVLCPPLSAQDVATYQEWAAARPSADYQGEEYAQIPGVLRWSVEKGKDTGRALASECWPALPVKRACKTCRNLKRICVYAPPNSKHIDKSRLGRYAKQLTKCLECSIHGNDCSLAPDDSTSNAASPAKAAISTPAGKRGKGASSSSAGGGSVNSSPNKGSKRKADKQAAGSPKKRTRQDSLDDDDSDDLLLSRSPLNLIRSPSSRRVGFSLPSLASGDDPSGSTTSSPIRRPTGGLASGGSARRSSLSASEPIRTTSLQAMQDVTFIRRLTLGWTVGPNELADTVVTQVVNLYRSALTANPTAEIFWGHDDEWYAEYKDVFPH